MIFTFPGSKYTTDSVIVHWYNGNRRPAEDIAKFVAPHKLPDQGSIYVGEKGVMFSPYIAMPTLMGDAAGKKIEQLKGENHYLQWVEAARGNGTASAPFEYAGPLTEMVLLGCLATRFPQQQIEWDAAKMKATNLEEANKFVRRTYRKGWDEPGLSGPTT